MVRHILSHCCIQALLLDVSEKTYPLHCRQACVRMVHSRAHFRFKSHSLFRRYLLGLEPPSQTNPVLDQPRVQCSFHNRNGFQMDSVGFLQVFRSHVDVTGLFHCVCICVQFADRRE
uniref:Uncharacterized protein n=1 Tax=Cacopsylla melanoneura TaxID=428564 RepID=A0A8D8WT09_9HEMI